MGHSSKPQCRGFLEVGMDEPQGKRKGYACLYLVTYFPFFFFASCRWNETFQKEVLSSRLETTQILAKAITKAPQPPKAWVLVTGVGMSQITSPLY